MALPFDSYDEKSCKMVLKLKIVQCKLGNKFGEGT